MAAVTGFLVMAVREARRCRQEVRAGNGIGAVDRLCWAWRHLAKAEGEPWHIRSTAGWKRSYARAWAAVDAVRTELIRAFRLVAIVAAHHGRRLVG